MGKLIDLFTKKDLGADDEFLETAAQGSDQIPEDEQEWFVEEFFTRYLGDLQEYMKGLEEAATVTDLEHWVGKIQEQVASWPTKGDD